MKRKLKNIGLILIGFLIIIQTKVFAVDDIQSLLEVPNVNTTKEITSLESRITEILGTAASIAIPIILVIAVVTGVIIWAVIYTRKSANKDMNPKVENTQENIQENKEESKAENSNE